MVIIITEKGQCFYMTKMLNITAAMSVPNVSVVWVEDEAGMNGVGVPVDGIVPLATGIEANVVAAGTDGVVITPAGTEAGAGVPTTS